MAPATAAAPNLGTKGHDLEKMMTRDRDKLNHVRGTQGCWCKPEPPHCVFLARPIHVSDICCEHHMAQHGMSR